MKKVKLFVITLTLAISVSSGLVVAMTPGAVGAAGSTTTPTPPKCPKNATTLGFPMWYRGVADEATCDIKVPAGKDGLSKFIWQIVLNIIDILLRLAGIVAVFFILYGGFQFITSQASADGATKARTTILNAIYGLAISMASVGIIQLIIGSLLK